VAAEWQTTTGLYIPAKKPIRDSIGQAADDQNRSKTVEGGRGGGVLVELYFKKIKTTVFKYSYQIYA
jgi:hypothetical protein